MSSFFESVKKTPITFSISFLYGAWWVFGVLYFKTHKYHSDIAGGIALYEFFVGCLIITALFFLGLKIAQRRVPEHRSLYKKYIIFLFLPYLLLIVFYGFLVIKNL
jgi:hypothetical protein